MRIDPSQLREPLSHVLNAGKANAAAGQEATKALRSDVDGVDRLDQMLLKRLHANSTTEAADSVLSFQDAQVKLKALQDAVAQDLTELRSSHGELQGGRVRGLLEG